MTNVVLTGFMGSGKTSAGKRLARMLNLPFVDVDRLIQERAGCSINEIFARHGEPYFRDLETDVLREVLLQQGRVVATGGGAVISPVNREMMHAHGVVVNLTAPISEIEKRLAFATDRPLLHADKGAKIRLLLEEREKFYADADVRIDTTGKNIEDVASEVVAYLKGNNLWNS